MIRIALVTVLSAVAVFAVDAPAAAKSARDKAMEVCKARTTSELGAGKIVKSRTKRLRSGYKVKFVKLTAEGDSQAKVACSVKSGEIVEFNVEQQTVVAR